MSLRAPWTLVLMEMLLTRIPHPTRGGMLLLRAAQQVSQVRLRQDAAKDMMTTSHLGQLVLATLLLQHTPNLH